MGFEPEIFQPLAVVLTKRGYEPFTSPGDRHGSWEWRFCRKSGDMTRFVILAATPIEDGADFEIEFWIGAEADQRFTRQRVASFHDHEQMARAEQRLRESVELAITKANNLGPSDLTERYAFSAQTVSVRQL